MNQVLELIGSHRSIRKFTDESIDEKLLKEIIGKAQYTSTSSFLQAYSVIRVNDKAARTKLATYAGDQPYIESAAEFLVFCADMNHIKIASDLHDVEMSQGYTESFVIATVDASLFAQSIMLGAESCGLGGVFIGGIRNHPKEICTLLEIPENVYPVFGMCLGHPAQDPLSKPRMPLDLILKDEKYSDLDRKTLEDYDAHVKDYYTKRTKGKVDYTWTEQVSERMKGELRPHMKDFLESKKLMTK